MCSHRHSGLEVKMASTDYFQQFLVLAEQLNYTSAAESLFMTESSLSRHIRSLEAELGVQLFSRTTQSVSLTPAGNIFRHKITKIMDEYEDLCSDLRSIKAGYANRLKISCPYYSVIDYLGLIPETFEGAHPDIRLEYSMGDPNEAIQKLLEDKVDITIAPLYSVPRSSVIAEKVFDESLGVLMSTDNPLASKEELTIGDLNGQHFFMVDNPYFSAFWQHILSLCRKSGFTPREPALFNQMEGLIMAIRSGGGGITIIGKHMRNQSSSLVAFRPLTGPEAKRPVCIIYKKGNFNPSIEKFISFYKKSYSDNHPFDGMEG